MSKKLPSNCGMSHGDVASTSTAGAEQSGARHAAVKRGLDFMYAYLMQDQPRRVLILGEQCVQMFYDVYISGADDTALCTASRTYALSLLEILDVQWRSSWPLPWTSNQVPHASRIVCPPPISLPVTDRHHACLTFKPYL